MEAARGAQHHRQLHHHRQILLHAACGALGEVDEERRALGTRRLRVGRAFSALIALGSLGACGCMHSGVVVGHEGWGEGG